MGCGASVAWPIAFATTVTCTGAEEWRIFNRRPVQGHAWRITEVEFFSGADCTGKLPPLQATAHIDPLPSDKVWQSQLMHAGDDCWNNCETKAGFCGWCGAGNACCKRDAVSDPPVCRGALGFTKIHHECVAVSSTGALQPSLVEHAFDGDLATLFSVTCQDCAADTLVVGAALGEGATPRCIAVTEPEPSPHPEGLLAELRLLRGQRQGGGPVQSCPGICRSGRYFEGHGKVPCMNFLSSHGWCGLSDFHRQGTDCRLCKRIHAPTWKEVPLRLVRRSSVTGQGGSRFHVWHLAFVEEPAHGAAIGSTAPVARVLHAGEDCWGACSGKSGYCSWCGEGNGCCKKGSASDAAECRRAVNFIRIYHECVELAVQHPGEDCWGKCGSKMSGFCSWCGEGNACCKRDFAGDPQECRRALGFTAIHHECVKLSPANASLAPPVVATAGPQVEARAPEPKRPAPPASPSSYAPLPPQPQPAGAKTSPQSEVSLPPVPVPKHGPPSNPALAKSPINGETLAESGPEEESVLHQARRIRGKMPEDCWGRCSEGSSGFCDSFCGEGRACCKEGFAGDPPECRRAQSFSVEHHQCVDLLLAPGDGPVSALSLGSAAFFASWAAAALAAFAFCRRGSGRRPPALPRPLARPLQGDIDSKRRQQEKLSEEIVRRELQEKASQLGWFV